MMARLTYPDFVETCLSKGIEPKRLPRLQLVLAGRPVVYQVKVKESVSVYACMIIR